MVTVTHGDEVRADGLHRNGVLRITIACTGVAAAHFSLCLHVKSRHLGDAYRYPTEPRTLAARLAPCGALPTHDQNRFTPLLEQHRNADCPAGHQPMPEFQCSINADVPDALRGTNQRLPLDTRFTAARRNLLDRPLIATIYTR
ncbi:hypothetical protein LF1_52330 [Rubripirellula obstinata]|uniref:Uncharacterized protein n=1 Tax=Rubripirellula obstinata TaxID=406547 RepID=A0A5B1CDE3_9BACT|nr:hypothetical protein LF1_52330 [Rubripirellula obstinata]